MKHEEYEFKISQVWPNYELTSSYQGSAKEISVLCKEHDEEFEITATRLSQGHTKCSKCKIEKKIKEEDIQKDFIEWFRNEYPDMLITCSGTFTNSNQVKKAVEMGYCKGWPDVF